MNEPECEAVKNRRALTKAIFTAVGRHEIQDLDGSQAQMLLAFSELRGIVAEYTNGGDEMAEGCTCKLNRHLHTEGNKGLTLDQIMTAQYGRG